MTLIPGLDPELILAEAARVHGIEEARFSEWIAVPLIEGLAHRVWGDLWGAMVNLRLLPIGESEQAHSHRMRMVLASHDPTHPELEHVIRRLNLKGYELRYAAELDLIRLLAAAFPWEYRALVDEVEEARARYAHPDVEAPPHRLNPRPVDDEEDVGLTDGLNTSSIITFFEDLLVQAVRKQTTGICLAPLNDDVTEVFFQVAGGLESWKVIDHIPPAALLHTVQHTILRVTIVPASADRHELKRWIDGKAVRFRLSMVPAGDLLHRKALLIRVLTLPT